MLVMAFDNRQVGETTISAWTEVAQRGRWTYDEAEEAVKEHFTESTDWLQPAHVTQRIREHRRQPPPPSSHLLDGPPKPAANPAHIRDVLNAIRERLGWSERYNEHHAALGYHCPYCRAAPGKPCTRQIGRGPKRGQFVAIAEPHPSRKDLLKGEEA